MFCPGEVGLLVAVLGSVSMSVSTTSMLVRRLVPLCDIVSLGTKQGMMVKWR